MPWTCSALLFQPIRSFTILLFFSVLKDLWYGLWFLFVNGLILQWKIWWMLMRILVFAFYLDHWWCQQRELFRKLRTLRAPLDGLKLNGAAVIPTQEYTVDCNATHKAVYSVSRTVYEPPRGILPPPI